MKTKATTFVAMAIMDRPYPNEMPCAVTVSRVVVGTMVDDEFAKLTIGVDGETTTVMLDLTALVTALLNAELPMARILTRALQRTT